MNRFVSTVLIFVILIWNCLFMAACASDGKLFEQSSITEPTYELWEQPSEETFYPFISEQLTKLYDILENVSDHVDNVWLELESPKAVREDPVFAEDYYALKNWAYGASNFDFAPYKMETAQAASKYLVLISSSLNEMADCLPEWMFSEDERAFTRCMETLKSEMAVLFSVTTQGDMPELLVGQEIVIHGIGSLKLRGAAYQVSVESLNEGSINFEVKDPGNEYLVIEFAFKNLSPEIKIDAVEESISAIVTYSDGYSYHAEMLAEASNRSGISRMFFVESGKTVRVLAIAEVPKAVQSEMALVNLWFAGTQYKILL